MRASELRRINKVFENFGRLSDGRLRIRWFDTTELFYFIEKDKETIAVVDKVETDGLTIPGGKPRKVTRPLLYAISTDWDRHSWAERIGRGWVLCVWQPPIPRDQFILRYGSIAPYQPNGEYKVIENTKRDEGDPPSARASELLKGLLLDMFYRGADIDGKNPKQKEIQESLVAQYERRQAATREEINQEIDDLMPAFAGKNHMPGKRGGSVSFGGLANAKRLVSPSGTPL